MTNAIVVAQELLSCLQMTLAAGPQPIPTEHVMLRAGSEVTPLVGTQRDECCEGLGWVRIQSVSGVRQIGDTLNVACFEAERDLTLELGVVRCAPSADSSTVPSAAQWMAAALQLDADMGAMEAAICCAFRDLEGSAAEEVSVGEYRPLGVDGNCLGGTMTVTIRMQRCCPPEE